MGNKSKSFRSKVVALTVAIVLGSQAATVAAVLIASSNDADDRAQMQLDSGIQLFRNVVTSRAKLLEQTVRPLAADSEFRKAVSSGDRNRIAAELLTRLSWVGADVAAWS